MSRWLDRFFKEQDGQDLIEYSLLIAFIALACVAVLGFGHPAIQGVWTTSNSRLSQANTSAS